MPSWMVHLATAKRVSEKIKVDTNSFILGNLIPDAEKHVIKDFSIYVPYNISHFSDFFKIEGKIEELPNIDKFMVKYKDKLSNPVVLGYLTHLLTDYYWNTTAYLRYSLRDKAGNAIGLILNDGTKIKCSIKERSRIKHIDFSLFENFIINRREYVIPKFEKSVMCQLKDIEEIKFNESDIEKIIEYVKIKSNEKLITDGEYKLFTKEQILKDYDESIKFIVDIIKKVGDIV